MESLKDRLEKALRPVLLEDVTYVTDDDLILEYLQSQNLPAFHFESTDLINLPKNRRRAILLLPTKGQNITYPKMRRLFKNSRVLIVPLQAFDPSYETAIYTLEKIAESDFTTAVEENYKWLSILERTGVGLEFEGGGTQFTCHLHERIQLMYPRTEPALMPGEWEAIGAFFEVAMTPDNEGLFHTGYTVDGNFQVEGVAVARHRVMAKPIWEKTNCTWPFFKAIYDKGGFPLQVKVVESQIKSITTSKGEDITGEVLEFSGKEYDLLLIEVAMSNNPELKTSMLDFSYNSVMNEGAKGVHIAVGDGVSGAHIDLICPGVKLVGEIISND